MCSAIAKAGKLPAISHELIARMDADDIACEERFERQTEQFLNDRELDICGSWIEEFEGDVDNVVSRRKDLYKRQGGWQYIASSCELIVVNDGSTDSSKGVIDTTCERFPNLNAVIISTKNQGASMARNAALDIAEGEYIAFLDADDRFSPCMLESMVAFSEEKGADFPYCGLTSDASRLCEEATTPEPKLKDGVFSTLLYRSGSLGFTSVLYRRETIDEHSLRFYESLRYGEGLAFLWEYALECAVFLRFKQPYFFCHLEAIPGRIPLEDYVDGRGANGAAALAMTSSMALPEMQEPFSGV